MGGPEHSPADDDAEIDGYTQHPLQHFFKLPVPPWRPDSESPPVDREKLQQLSLGVLDDEAARPLWQNILRYRPWAHAYGEIGAEEFRRKRKD